PRSGHRHRQADAGAARARSPPPDRHLRADRELFRGALRPGRSRGRSRCPRPPPRAAPGGRHHALSTVAPAWTRATAAGRFEAAMAAGFLEEVRSLRRNGALTARHPSMRAVGYRQLWAHLDGQYPLEEAVRRGVAATRQLAKRQLTWLRGEALGRWIEPQAG